MHGIARVLSKLGVASRTEAADLVAAGRVSLNGRAVRDPEQPADRWRDRIEVDGRPVAGAAPVYLARHKPAGLLTTAHDPEGRPTVYGLLPPDLPSWVFPVGRLDGPTSGLLLFTNDARVGDALTNPDVGVPKTYEVKVKGQVSPAKLEALRDGVELDDGYVTSPAQVRVMSTNEGSTWMELTIREGKNRQVRRMGLAVGHEVVKLRRTRVGPVELGELPSGQVRPLTSAEVRALRAIGKVSAPRAKRDARRSGPRPPRGPRRGHGRPH
ncbi:MAG: rRNA pseudouridine synthase [Planctomycetia bacterium]|nr:rRNA pseudouridine synthase [Planctomycetia bacterium]